MTLNKLRSERAKRGTQAEVAEKLGVHRVTVARWETGTRKISRMARNAILALPNEPKRTPENENL